MFLAVSVTFSFCFPQLFAVLFFHDIPRFLSVVFLFCPFWVEVGLPPFTQWRENVDARGTKLSKGGEKQAPSNDSSRKHAQNMMSIETHKKYLCYSHIHKYTVKWTYKTNNTHLNFKKLPKMSFLSSKYAQNLKNLFTVFLANRAPSFFDQNIHFFDKQSPKGYYLFILNS